MLPHERTLVTRLQGKPFALVGINGDDDPKAIQEQSKKHGVTWRSFKNSQGPDGKELADLWNLQGWPTLYLIDHQGTIRKKWLGSPGDKILDKEIDNLVKEAEKAEPRR